MKKEIYQDDCETCRVLVDLIETIQPNDILYTQYTPLASFIKDVLDRHIARAHTVRVEDSIGAEKEEIEV